MGLFRSSWANGVRGLIVVFIIMSMVFIGISLWQTTSQVSLAPLADSQPQVTQNFSYFVEQSNPSSAQMIASQLDGFTTSRPDDIPFDLGNHTYWVLLNITNPSDQTIDLVLHLDNAMLFEPVAFDVNSLVSNQDQSLEEVIIRGQVFPRLEIMLPANNQRSLLLKLKAGGPPNIPLILYEQSVFTNKTQLTLVLYGAFIAVILVMAVYNLVLFAAIKDVVYVLYVGYLLSSLIVLGSVIGFGYLIFPPEVQHFINQHSLFFHYYLVLFLLFFSLYFLRYDQTKGTLYWLGLLFSGALLILSVVSQWLSHESQANLFFGLQPLFYLICVVLLINRINRSYTWARFYFISWILLLLGAAIQPLMLLNQLEYSFLNRNAFLLAVFVEIIFMAFALAERMRRFELERAREISYHPKTQMPRKVLIENAIAALSKEADKTFSVLVIEPEQIDRISLYVDDDKKTQLLKCFYQKLSLLFTFNDAIVRLGDKDEKICLLSDNRLAIIVDHQHSRQSLNILIGSIQEKVEQAYQLDGLKLPLSAVVGVANYPEHGTLGHLLLNRAQLAIAHAKIDYQQWCYFEERENDKTDYYLALASDIKNAIANGVFELYHQPQIDLKTLKVCGSEVLLRWNHHEQGFIPPNVFIPVAEDVGLINRLSQWVMQQAIKQQLILHENGYNHMISINISGKDLVAEEFYNFVVELLDDTNFPASKIALELTESSTIFDNKRAIAVMEKLVELGVTVSIDDFGAGYSSMAYISELPFQELKVDRQLVENICADKRRKVITETTVRMAKGLGLEVVAEGVNSRLDEETVKGFGCDIGQGYYYAKPMPLNDYLIWLSNEVNGQVTQEVVDDLEGEFIPKTS